MCRQTDTLRAQEGFPRLPSSEGTGCLVAPESKYPRTAPETCVHVKGGLWEEGALPSEAADPSSPRRSLSVGSRLLPPLPSYCPLRGIYLPGTFSELCCAPPSPLPCGTPPLRGRRGIWKEMGLGLNCLPLESPLLLLPPTKKQVFPPFTVSQGHLA